MNLDEIQILIKSLSQSEKNTLLEALPHSNQTETNAQPPLSAFDFSSLPQILIEELKRQNITYEEMAFQIGVSLSTFKRMIANPSAAKAINLHELLEELGIKVWLGK